MYASFLDAWIIPAIKVDVSQIVRILWHRKAPTQLPECLPLSITMSRTNDTSETVIKSEKVTSRLFQMKRLSPISIAIIKNQIINGNFEKCTVTQLQKGCFIIYFYILQLYVTYCRSYITIKIKKVVRKFIL